VARKAGRRRYTAAEKKNILDTAVKENLTGAQVQKRFGIAQLTFYRWRGPVRGKRATGGRPGRPAGGVSVEAIRSEVRAGIQRVLPEVIRQEVQSYLAAILGRAPGRRRGRKPGPKPGSRRGRPAKKK
jgi:transposase-like protein